MILDDIRQFIDRRLVPWATAQGLAEVPPYALEEPPAGIEGDVACNIAMLLAKPLRKAPRSIAHELQTLLSIPHPLVEEVHVAGAGFLNFRYTLSRLHQEVSQIHQAGSGYGRLGKMPDPPQRVLIEFVSANPTGPLHVGHGRGAALGDSLALILAHLGYAVSREYYINDAGNQVHLLGESVRARCLELQGKPFTLPVEGYHGDYVKEIAQRYLDQHPHDVDLAEQIVSFSLSVLQREIQKDLEDFGVRFDSWFSEQSLVQKKLVEKHIQTLRKRGFVQDYEEAVWFVAPGEKEDDCERERDKNRVLRRRDGRWTYFATDIAYHADKLERGFDRLIDIWGADHHGYVARVKGSLQALGFDAEKLHILLYQLVSLSRGGVPVSMSKRSGDFITLREVLQEVGRDACRFFFAMRSPNTAFDFDLELAKKHTNDNPVYYVQYAHARICSIFRQAGDIVGADSGAPLHLLIEKEERDLMKRLALFPQVLHLCAQEDSPHPLATYLLLLCRQFHYFYDNHRVLGENKELTSARLSLLDAVRRVLGLGLHLLGVSAPESM